jgi:hypothetical protein
MLSRRLLTALLALAALAACHRGSNLESEAAVKQAIDHYLSSRPNLNVQSMDMQVSGIRFRGQEAEADVVFRARHDAQATITMKYTLRREGDSWRVTPQAAGSLETGHGMLPPGESGSGELPSGHPPVGGQSELPPGHPPVQPKHP